MIPNVLVGDLEMVQLFIDFVDVAANFQKGALVMNTRDHVRVVVNDIVVSNVGVDSVLRTGFEWGFGVHVPNPILYTLRGLKK
jgi:hypothetical protein